MRVIARAYADQPLDRLVTGEAGNMVYVINPSAVSASGITPMSGVGFPRDSVHQFDSDLFESLASAWAEGDEEMLQSLWKAAAPIACECVVAPDVVEATA